MGKKARVTIIIDRLEDLYPQPKVPLHHTNDYTLLVAVVLSAQSTDKKVNELTSELFSLVTKPEEMYSLGEEVIYSYIKELGLAKQKAKNIFYLSKRLIEKYSSKVPNNLNDLESLPGVGHKTASVVMAQAFGVPSFPVDTHIHRLAQRWELTNGKSVKKTEEDLKRLFPKNKWSKLHLQIIYYGREYCSARQCYGKVCPICRELFPNRKKAIIHKKA